MPSFNNPISSNVNAPDSISAFLTLAQDPKAFAIKLAELNQARDEANLAKEEAVEAKRQLSVAKDVDVLFRETEANKKASENLLSEARLEASRIKEAINQEASGILKNANEASEAIGIKARKILAQAQQTLDSAYAKQAEVDAKLVNALAREQQAQVEIDKAKAEQKNAIYATELANRKLSQIQREFDQFIKVVS